MKILLAEDDVMLADALHDALIEDGHAMCGNVATVAEAVTLARLHRPDISILDMTLSQGERGSDIADQLAESGDIAQMAILYITGNAERVQKEARVGHACLSKPYTSAALNAALDIVHDIAVTGTTTRPLPPGLQLLG